MTLILLAGAGAASVALARIDPSQRTEDIRIYPNAEACSAGRVRTADECRADYAEALRTYATAAPTYPTLDLCEAQHGIGQCRRRDAAPQPGGDAFVPLMVAYAVGLTAAQKLEPQPLFRNADAQRGLGLASAASYRTSWGCPIAPAADGASSAARVPAASVRRTVFGGFGATGREVCGDPETTHHGGS
ncbi:MULTISPECIES: DUF1190 domain-containing protein [Methylobacterium]|uniref:DUF1190 domain-containing protein n=1 Tax=Methylobacterium TaxID=407 RepID=UPI00138F45D6|nr:DUF1190 domain-containing protein [Methylobacterium sp. Leaf104]MCI9881334.1 DUF1190 domain-containing protein [Methylobacterium goesingense]